MTNPPENEHVHAAKNLLVILKYGLDADLYERSEPKINALVNEIEAMSTFMHWRSLDGESTELEIYKQSEGSIKASLELTRNQEREKYESERLRRGADDQG